MQNTQNVVWWLEILKIAVPSVIALVVPFIAGYLLLKRTENYKKELSKEIEDYKKDISRDLENYKFQLQSNFQTQFYQFQTKFSLFHQRRIENLEKLYELVAKIEIGIQEWSAFDTLPKYEITKQEFYFELFNQREELTRYFDLKRIYFNDEVISTVIDFVYFITDIIVRPERVNFQIEKNFSAKDQNDNAQLYKKCRTIEAAILNLLTTEIPAYNLAEKSLAERANNINS